MFDDNFGLGLIPDLEFVVVERGSWSWSWMHKPFYIRVWRHPNAVSLGRLTLRVQLKMQSVVKQKSSQQVEGTLNVRVY